MLGYTNSHINYLYLLMYSNYSFKLSLLIINIILLSILIYSSKRETKISSLLKKSYKSLLENKTYFKKASIKTLFI